MLEQKVRLLPSERRRMEKTAYDLAFRRDGGVSDKEAYCQKCGRFGLVQMDHRQNRMPGNTVASNLQALCAADHQFKTENPAEALRTGYAVLRHTTLTPAEWPARRRVPTGFGTVRLGWVLYFDAPEHGRMWFEIADIEAHYRLKAAGVL